LDKVRMLMKLPASSTMLMQSFKSKLRSQITRPLKEGLTTKVGGVELLEDFYRVFAINMRDLGSPVHSVELIQHVLSNFSEDSRILVVYSAREAVACALVIGFSRILRNPWASSLRKYASLSPNMLLYMRMLEFACDNGYESFDFGRSTKGEGTYRFKEQWGAVPAPLYWYYFPPVGDALQLEGEQRKFEYARYCWKKLPVVVTKAIGPRIRKYISL
jgi:serine/alanine adding enzyme